MSFDLSDVIQPEVFNEMMAEKSVTADAFVKSGVVVPHAAMQEAVTSMKGGQTRSFTVFEEYEATETQPIDAPSGKYGSTNEIEAAQREQYQVDAPLLWRNQAWGADNFVNRAGHMDSMADIATQVMLGMRKEHNKYLRSIVEGIAAVTAASGIVTDVSAATGNYTINGQSVAKNLASRNSFIESLRTWSDDMESAMGGMYIMHPDVYYDLLDQNQNDFRAPNEQGFFTTFLGKSLMLDSTIKTEGTGSDKKYHTYQLLPGLLQEGFYSTSVVDANERANEGAGNQLLILRKRFGEVVNGFSWTSSTKKPSNTQLATASNWTYRHDDVRRTPLRVLISKTSQSV